MNKPKYPIEKYLGEYESFVFRLRGSDALKATDRHCQKFFSYFPKDAGLEQFTIADVADYKIWRRREKVSAATIQVELGFVRAFWRWLAEHRDLPLQNPVTTRPTRNRNTKSLKLEDFRLLYAGCSDQLKRFLIAALLDFPHTHSRSQRFNRELRDTAAKAGLPWIITARQLRGVVQRSLWREIVRRGYPELSDALFNEAEGFGHAPTDIETAPRDVGTTIVDRDVDGAVVCGVEEFEWCT